MRPQFCDLHTHSYYSDGTKSPAQIVDEAKKAGLSAVALTDHNTVEGLPEFLHAAKENGVCAVGGIEFSAMYRDKELHIVALFVGEQYFKRITDLVSEVHRKKEESNIKLVFALREAGYNIDYEKIKNSTKGGVNRAHIATALVENGYCNSVKEAFSELLSEEKGFYVPPERLSVFEVLELICDIVAVSVIAHPFLQMNEQELREFLTVAKPFGLCAMETRYSTYTKEQTALAEKIAQEFGIMQSGGSDYHAERKPDIFLGCGRGDLFVPFSFYENMKASLDN